MSVTHKTQFIYNKKNDKFVGEKQVALQVNEAHNERQEEQEKHENVYKINRDIHGKLLEIKKEGMNYTKFDRNIKLMSNINQDLDSQESYYKEMK